MKLTYKSKRLTPLEKMEIIELKVNMVAAAGYRCFKCGELLGGRKQAQLAHIIRKSEANYKKYGYEVINHPLNLKVSCSDCNSYAMIGINKQEHENMIRKELGLKPIYRN